MKKTKKQRKAARTARTARKAALHLPAPVDLVEIRSDAPWPAEKVPVAEKKGKSVWVTFWDSVLGPSNPGRNT